MKEKRKYEYCPRCRRELKEEFRKKLEVTTRDDLIKLCLAFKEIIDNNQNENKRKD